jgi:hypothetical protein
MNIQSKNSTLQGQPPFCTRYFVPELDLEIKTERVNYCTHVAYFPSGPERVKKTVEMKNWVFKGRWEEKK